MKLKKFFKLFQHDERGVTALEYAILAGVVVVGVIALGGKITGLYDSTFTALNTKVTAAMK